MEIHDEKMAGTQTLQTQDHLLAGGHLVFLSRSTVSGSGNYRRKGPGLLPDPLRPLGGSRPQRTILLQKRLLLRPLRGLAGVLFSQLSQPSMDSI